MKHASISLEAEVDIDRIAAYTTENWGWVQTDRYLGQLEDSFRLQANLRRFEVGKHVVFYRTEPGGIRIVRVLHQQMIPSKSQFEQ